MSEELYRQIRKFRDCDLYADAEKAAIEYAELFATNHAAIDDAVFDRLRKHFDAGEMFELSVLIARHFAFGRLTKVLEIDIVCALPSTTQVD